MWYTSPYPSSSLPSPCTYTYVFACTHCVLDSLFSCSLVSSLLTAYIVCVYVQVLLKSPGAQGVVRHTPIPWIRQLRRLLQSRQHQVSNGIVSFSLSEFFAVFSFNVLTFSVVLFLSHFVQLEWHENTLSRHPHCPLSAVGAQHCWVAQLSLQSHTGCDYRVCEWL